MSLRDQLQRAEQEIAMNECVDWKPGLFTVPSSQRIVKKLAKKRYVLFTKRILTKQ